MGRMKTKNVHEFLIPSACLLMVLSFRSAPPNALVSAQTFSLSDGDSFTCNPIQAQISLNGATFNRYPTTVINPGSSTSDSRGAMLAQQTIMAEADACPEGTIPIRADRGNLHENKIGPRLARMSQQFPSSQKTVAPIVENVKSAPHEYGIAFLNNSATPSPTYFGTEVFINVWDPLVDSSGEFSLAQLWVISGPLNTIEAGYQVSNGFYGDGLPRLFVYWTANGYKNSGCYDLSCAGFVQVSNKVLLGGSFSTSTISSLGGQQYEIKYQVFKDDGTGDWWLQLNDEYVGYWPKNIYVNKPFDYSNLIEWGGEIVDDEYSDGNEHTTTEMGSGQFPNEGYGEAAYLRNLQYIDINNNLVDAPFYVAAAQPKCYNAVKGTGYPNWRSFFFYGGKGLSPGCLHDPAYEAPPPSSSLDDSDAP